MPQAAFHPVLRSHARSILVVCVSAACAVVASGCGEKKPTTAPSQVAAKVNTGEVTIHQVNLALQAQRNVRPDQAETAGNRILERLIDQELAVQKAEALKIDRDPKVMQQLQAARSEIIAKAYFDKITDGVSKPSPEEITAYFNDNPALFKERRIYQLQEIAVQAQPAQLELLQRQIEGGKSVDDIIVFLRSNNVPYTTAQVLRAAEQVPMSTLTALAKLRDGQSMLLRTPGGVQVIALTESRLQPIEEERARPAIEQFMINDRKRKVVADDVRALRTAAKIEYVGKFATAASAPGDLVPTVADAAASAARMAPGGDAAAAPVVPVTPQAPVSAASAPLSTNIINKGLGLK